MSGLAAVAPADAPAAIGPYSPGIIAGPFVFVSGQIPLNPATGEMVAGDAAAQTEQVMKNLAAVLRAAGSSPDRIVKTTIYLIDLEDFAVVNGVYGRFVGTPPPARATVQVARLPRDARVEIDAIARL
ncbi:MAG: RidA family protein [Vicinamibacterales bacterium]